MSSITQSSAPALRSATDPLPSASVPHAERRRGAGGGVALAVMICAQLMIVIDMTVVNVALPSIASSLRFSAPALSWVLNSYTLTFGGLLLLGGRAGDILGRRPVFLAGLAIFTAGSLAGGLAATAPMLLAARAVQGAGGAIASPAVLATIVSSFPEGRERTRALGIFTAVTMGGASLGLVLGGIITEWASWRWVLFVNVPIGIAVIVIASRVLPGSPRRAGRFDVTGALASTAGMALLVYGFISAAAGGWGGRATLTAFGCAAVLLAAFVVSETRSSQPIMPLHLFADRNRAASYLARLLLVAGMFGMFFFLTQFVQEVLGFSPLRAGLSFIPMTGALFALSRLVPGLIRRFGPKPLMVAGLLPVLAGMAWLARISPGTAYDTGILGPMLLIGSGMGITFVPLTMASLAGVRSADSGAASSMVNAIQQVGGSLGLAVLVTVFGRASHAAASGPLRAAGPLARARDILAGGMAGSFEMAAILSASALLAVVFLIRLRAAAAEHSR